MAYMEWTAELEFGIQAIDDQHKRIVGYINELADAIKTGNKDEVNHVIEGLLDYTITHFEFEESLQEKAGYPFLKGHQRIHEVFMKKVAAIRGRASQGENVAPELLQLLTGWLANHIKVEDRDYVEVVKRFTGDASDESTGWLSATLKRFFG